MVSIDLRTCGRSQRSFFEHGDFPHYVEVYGEAANVPPGDEFGHITEPSGSRSMSVHPAPFPDRLHGQLHSLDYDAADDARYTSATPIIETTRTNAWPAQGRTNSETEDGVAAAFGENTTSSTPSGRTGPLWSVDEADMGAGGAAKHPGHRKEDLGQPHSQPNQDGEDDTDDEDEDWGHVKKLHADTLQTTGDKLDGSHENTGSSGHSIDKKTADDEFDPGKDDEPLHRL